jgi:hypothetical protein
MTFPNLAGHTDPDPIAKAELEAAGITAISFECLRNQGEVKTAVIGQIGEGHVSWGVTRAWSYWVAKGPGLPIEISERLYESHGQVVRVDGHCGCPSPSYMGGFAVSLYHVDTPEGLKALADAIKGVQEAHSLRTGGTAK